MTDYARPRVIILMTAALVFGERVRPRLASQTAEGNSPCSLGSLLRYPESSQREFWFWKVQERKI